MSSNLGLFLFNTLICVISFSGYLWVKAKIRKKTAREITYLSFGPKAVCISKASEKLIRREFSEYELKYPGSYLVIDWLGNPPKRKAIIMHPIDFHNAYEFIYSEEPDHFVAIRLRPAKL